jgi:hypothetical protein
MVPAKKSGGCARTVMNGAILSQKESVEKAVLIAQGIGYAKTTALRP